MGFLFALSFRGAFILSIVFGLIYQFTLFDNGDSVKQEIENMINTYEQTQQDNVRLEKENSF